MNEKSKDFRQLNINEMFYYGGKRWTKTAYFPSLDQYGRNAVAEDGEREIFGEPTIVQEKP